MILFLIVVAFLVALQHPRIAAFFNDSGSLEKWAGHSRARMFGAPALVALLLTTAGVLSGQPRTMGTVFGTGFFLLILFNLSHMLTGAKSIRLGVQMVFLLFFFGTALSLLAMHLLHL